MAGLFDWLRGIRNDEVSVAEDDFARINRVMTQMLERIRAKQSSAPIVTPCNRAVRAFGAASGRPTFHIQSLVRASYGSVAPG